MLVLRPPMTIDRFFTVEFMVVHQLRPGGDLRANRRDGPALCPLGRAAVPRVVWSSSAPRGDWAQWQWHNNNCHSTNRHPYDDVSNRFAARFLVF
jgi:hypothetical protein